MGGATRRSLCGGLSTLQRLLTASNPAKDRRRSRRLFSLPKLADHTCRNVADHRVGGHVPGHYSARGDHAVIADGYTGQDDGACAEPAVVANGDGVAAFPAFGALLGVVHGVFDGDELAAGAEEGAGADGDGGDVEDDAVEVQEAALTEGGVHTVFEV